MGRTTTYTYDANGNKTSTTYPQTASSTNTTSATAYNQYSEPTSTTDELGNTRAFNYDDSYNPQNVTDALGTLASFQFNTDGTMQNGAVGYDITAQAAMASHFAYDSNGSLASRTDALGRTTSYTYDSMGHKLTMTEPAPSGSSAAAATTNYSYDDFGNLTQSAAPLGRTTSSTFDANGNKLTDIDANGHTTSYTYDALNRLTLTTYPDGTTSSKTYDFRSNVVTETDQGGHVTQHVYDLAGRESSVTRAYGTSSATTTSYDYDDAGRKVSETDSLGHSTSYTYDAAGNLTGMSGVKGNFTYAYDNARNRVSMTDGKGNTTGYKYDARKRLVETDYPDGTKATNSYDGPGNLIKVIDQASHEVDYAYDAANQLQQVTQASSPSSANTTVVGYDADGKQRRREREMKDTLIGWCHHTINFWLGCNRADSAECEGCYAEAQMTLRGKDFNVLRPTRESWYEAERLNAGAKARNTHELVFTCSLSDFFHQGADIWREEAWDVIRRCRNLVWLILTKRPQRILDHLPQDWDEGRGYPHVWLGTTCGTKKSFSRVDELKKIPCALRFLSCEPLLEDISEIDLHGIGWVLCGGMSGPLHKDRSMDLRWAAALYQTAHSAGVPFLFKQVSHNLTERGINALGLLLAQRSGKPADPERVDCIRQYPELTVPFTAPAPKGVRWSAEDWTKYLRTHSI